MRLLNTKTLLMEDFNFPPPYAILSHRWGKHEVTFEQFTAAEDKSRREFDKVNRFCKLARSRGHDYAWIDTCCIDKRSSAELTECINSMWAWYEGAKECIALLVDVGTDGAPYALHEFNRSVWFTRGWTLQELLAPRLVVFVSSEWQVIGKKSDPDLLRRISVRTRIPQDCLINQFALHSTCVAKKLSWAAYRRTTRDEDMAYCLLGLLDVNMPLLYGEGLKAFLRLQHEIIRQSDDESVFAWRHISPPPGLITGVLATHVTLFANSGDVRRVAAPRKPYAITNKGLKFRSDVTLVDDAKPTYLVPLNCEYGVAPNVSRCAMAVVEEETETFYRLGTSRLGDHLENMFAHLRTQKLQSLTFYIQVTRWQHTFQPALFMIKKSVERYKLRKAFERERLENDSQPAESRPENESHLIESRSEDESHSTGKALQV